MMPPKYPINILYSGKMLSVFLADHKGLLRDLTFYASRATDQHRNKLEPELGTDEDQLYRALCRGNVKVS